MKQLADFGKFCKKLRIDNEQITSDVAKCYGVSCSFISAMEHGERNIPEHIRSVLIKLYNLTNDQQKELDKIIFDHNNKTNLDLTKFDDKQRKAILDFAYKLKEERRRLDDNK